jgi:hypothetical protein
VGVLLGLPNSALAEPPDAPPETCATLKYITPGTQVGTQQNDHKGVKSLVWFGAYTQDCVRVSSLLVAPEGINSQVEFGWFLGWHGYGNPPNACGPKGYQDKPTLFMLSWTLLGGFYCQWGYAQNPSQWRLLTLQDANQDQGWSAFLGDEYTNVFGVHIDFTHGTLYAGGERHSSNDSAWAHFLDLKRLRITDCNQQSCYVTWNNTQCYSAGSNDPDYKFSKTSNTEFTVERGSGC